MLETINSTQEGKLDAAITKIEHISDRRRSHIALEMSVWMFFALTPFILGYVDFIHAQPVNRTLGLFLSNYSSVFIVGLVILSVPAFWKLIFDTLPMEALRIGIRRLFSKEKEQVVASLATPNIDARIAQYLSGDMINAKHRVDYFNSNQLMSLYAIESKRVATRTFMLAGAFLLAGLLVGAFGIGYFDHYNTKIFSGAYMRDLETVAATGATPPKVPVAPMDLLDRFVNRIPGISILFFIEFGAYFLMRLFKSTMDDYRYYEEIARNREATFIAMKMAFERGDTSDTKSLVDTVRLYSSAGRLGKDETSDLIEMRKLHEDEIIIPKKLIDAIGSKVDTKSKADPKKE